jgi:site-specific DNA recombinase
MVVEWRSENLGEVIMADRAAIYARVSTDDQADNYSLPTQVEACQQYATEKGLQIVAEFREDYTGSELDRPELNDLRELARQGAIEWVLTFKLDRLARDFVIPFIIERELGAFGVQVRYVNARYDESESGETAKMLDAVIAHVEKRNIVERFTRGKRAAIRAGKVIMNSGQVDIYGYCRADKIYVISEAEAKIVRLIFQWYLAGDETGQKLGSAQIAIRLNAMGVPAPIERKSPTQKTKTKGRSKQPKREPLGWHRGTVSRILRNEAYTGVVYYGKTKSVKDPRTGKRKLLDVPPDQWIRCEIPAIIDRETWEQSRATAERNYTFSKRNTKYSYLLSKRIKCSCCGHALWGFTPRDRYAYYKCKGTDRSNYPDGKAICSGVIRAELVDTIVWEAINDFLKNPEQIIDVLRTNQAEFERQESPLRLSLDSTTALLVEAKQERDRLVNGYTKGFITEAEFEHKGKEALERIQALTEQEQRLQGQLSKQTIPDHLIDDITAVCEQIRVGIENFTFDEKRHVLELLNIEAVVQRGATRRDDNLILTGYIPTTIIFLSEGTYKLQNAQEYIYPR